MWALTAGAFNIPRVQFQGCQNPAIGRSVKSKAQYLRKAMGICSLKPENYRHPLGVFPSPKGDESQNGPTRCKRQRPEGSLMPPLHASFWDSSLGLPTCHRPSGSACYCNAQAPRNRTDSCRGSALGPDRCRPWPMKEKSEHNQSAACRPQRPASYGVSARYLLRLKKAT